MMGLEPTDDLEIGRKMVQEKIKRDGISEEHLNTIIEKAASELAAAGKLDFSSNGSQQNFADGSFKDFDKLIGRSNKSILVRFGFFSISQNPKVNVSRY